MAYIGREPQIGNFQVCDAISVVNGQAAYTMQVSSVNVSPETANHMLVSLNGVLQAPTSSYTVSGSTITFASNLVTGDVIDFIHILGSVLDLGVPSDSTVSLAKLTATGTKDATTFLRGDNSFQEVSSDYVLLSTVDITSSTAEAEFDGLFSSTYKNYKIIISGLLPVTNSARLNAQMKEGGSYITSGAYTYLIGSDIVYNTTDSGSSNIEAATNGTKVVMTSEMTNTTSETNSLEITIYDPLGSHYKAMTWHNQNYGSALTNLFRNYVGGSVMRNGTSDCTAIKFYMDSGNIVKGNFKLYGIK